MSPNDLFDYAKQEMDLLGTGEEFALKDLFKGYVWKRIKQGDKSTVGTLFLSYINERDDVDVIRKRNGIFYKKKI